MQDFGHVTVLLEEAIQAIAPHSGGRYVDCTLGGGGHTAQLLRKSEPNGCVLAIDQDPTALEHARQRFAGETDRLTLVRSNFRELRRVIADEAFGDVDGVLFDLGVSSPQFDQEDRGFSYRMDAALDMRMDPSMRKTAADLVRELDETELAKIFFMYGEEKFSRRIARAIVQKRAAEPIETTGQLAELIKDNIPAPARRTGGHPAKRVFQALRIAVNDELRALEDALSDAFEVLRVGGRVAVISFHSLEDRIVKHQFAEWAQGCVCPPDFPVCRCGRTPKAKIITRRPIGPGEHEIERNPRARSAKLRVAERLP